MAWFKAQAEGRKASVTIDKVIGSDWAPDWVSEWTGEETAREFIDKIESFGELDCIDLTLNCPGGDVASGVRIMNYLRNHNAEINVRVDGMAASIATVIMMAGDTRVMGVGSTLMVHNPAGMMMGYYTEAEMLQNADAMAKVTTAIVDAYTLGTGKDADEIRTLLDQGDTYLTATDAIEWGFATDKDETLKAVASIDKGQYKAQFAAQANINALQAQVAGLEEQLLAEMEVTERLKAEPVVLGADAVFQMCDAKQLGDLAAQMLRDKVTEAQAQARLVTASALQDIEAAAGLTELTQYAADPVDAVRALALQLKEKDAEINSQQQETSGSDAKKAVNPASIYNKLNQRGAN
ncbi:MAG: head maturation protease, ClpP-related [Pontibacterium sp.]